MTLKLCKDHFTVLVFTGITWCGNCKRMEPELEKLRRMKHDDFDFMHFDDVDTSGGVWKPSKYVPLFKNFGVVGVPTILIYNPFKNTFLQYDGPRTASDISECAIRQICTGMPRTEFPAIELESHAVLNQQKEEPEMYVVRTCREHPGWIIATTSWCGVCQDAKPILEKIKEENKNHTLDFDADKNQEFQKALGIVSVPSVFYFEPKSGILRKVQLRDINNPEDAPIYKNATIRFDLIDCDGFGANDQKKEVMNAECPAMNAECPAMNAECPAMNAECPTIDALFDEPETKNITWEASCPNLNAQEMQQLPMQIPAQIPMQELDRALLQQIARTPCNNYVFDLCGSCVTFFIFTGMEWCDECKNFAKELTMLKHLARCGEFHIEHFDYSLNSNESRDKRICNLFGVKRFPTVLAFDPNSFEFCQYTGVLSATDMKMAPRNMRFFSGNTIPTPHEVSFRFSKMPLPNSIPMSQANNKFRAMGNYRGAPSSNWQLTAQPQMMSIRLCARCPTILIFALDATSFESMLKRDGQSVHVFCFAANKLQDRTKIQAFNVDLFPFILVFNHQNGLFYVYHGSSHDVDSILNAYKSNMLRKVWNDHPHVLLEE